MTPIEYEARLDPGGKKVDVVQSPAELDVISFAASPANGRDQLLGLALEALGRLGRARSATVRDRELVVWWGEVESVQGRLTVVGLPKDLNGRAYGLLQPLSQLPGRLDHGTFAFADTQSSPLAGYYHGRLVAYGDPFAPPGLVAGVEVRSAEVPSSKRAKVVRKPFPGLARTHGPVYGIDEWKRAATDLFEVIDGLLAAGTYRSLRRLASSDLGMEVVERSGASFPRFGRISVGVLRETPDGAPGCRVRIELSRDLPPQSRYAVLAHELAHFVLHFPLLLANQVIEEVAWEEPRILPAWRRRLGDAFPPYQTVERETDRLAAYFLVPPWCFPVQRLADVMWVSDFGRPDPRHLIWHFLQPLFRDTEGMSYSWVNWDDHERRAAEQVASRDDMALDDRGLYDRMLDAALANEEATTARTPAPVASRDAAAELAGWAFRSALRLAGPERSGVERGAPWTAPDMPTPDLPSDIVGARGSVVEPVRPPAGDVVVLPLLPSGTKTARGERNWRAANDLDRRGTTIGGWQKRAPDRRIIIYPNAFV